MKSITPGPWFYDPLVEPIWAQSENKFIFIIVPSLLSLSLEINYKCIDIMYIVKCCTVLKLLNSLPKVQGLVSFTLWRSDKCGRIVNK